MTGIDQFEAVFKSAAKRRFNPAVVEIRSVLVATDLPSGEAKLFRERVRTLLRVLPEDTSWELLHDDDCRTIGELLEQVERVRPDLLVTYRNLHSGSWRWPYSLGEHIDVLTQVTTTPVLLMPRPDREAHALGPGPSMSDDTRGLNTDSVMAITDHVAGDDRLVNFAARFTSADGTLFLTHIEDQAVFERYIDAISKIATIDTTSARRTIHEQLLKDAGDYIESCASVLASGSRDLSVHSIVTTGDHLSDYQRLISEHGVDLLVFNTKDADQMAMHGLAYPLAIELRDTPLLML